MNDFSGDEFFETDPDMKAAHTVKGWYENVLAKDPQLQRGAKIDIGNTYRSSHWDEPNVLAHVRTNDRAVGGKPALHLEEIQSDFGQAHRKQAKMVAEYVDKHFDEVAARMVDDGIIKKECD